MCILSPACGRGGANGNTIDDLTSPGGDLCFSCDDSDSDDTASSSQSGDACAAAGGGDSAGSGYAASAPVSVSPAGSTASSSSGGGGGSPSGSGSGSSTNSSDNDDDYDSDNSGSGGSGGGGGSGGADDAEGHHHEPKPPVPPVTRSRSLSVVREHLTTFLEARAWESLKEQLKLSASCLAAEEVKQWKARRSRGMKLARNRRYGNRRRERERKEAAALEAHARLLEHRKAQLVLSLTGGADVAHQRGPAAPLLVTPLAAPLTVAPSTTGPRKRRSAGGCGDGGGTGGAALVAEAGRGGHGHDYDDDDFAPTKRLAYVTPHMRVDQEDWPMTTTAAPYATSSSPMPAAAAFGSTAFRLFAVVAVGVFMSAFDADNHDGSFNITGGPGPGPQHQHHQRHTAHGHVLSGFYLLNSRSVVAFVDSFPAAAVLAAVVVTMLGLALAVAAGAGARATRTDDHHHHVGGAMDVSVLAVETVAAAAAVASAASAACAASSVVSVAGKTSGAFDTPWAVPVAEDEEEVTKQRSWLAAAAAPEASRVGGARPSNAWR
jgi:hypothetical protein